VSKLILDGYKSQFGTIIVIILHNQAIGTGSLINGLYLLFLVKIMCQIRLFLVTLIVDKSMTLKKEDKIF